MFRLDNSDFLGNREAGRGLLERQRRQWKLHQCRQQQHCREQFFGCDPQFSSPVASGFNSSVGNRLNPASQQTAAGNVAEQNQSQQLAAQAALAGATARQRMETANSARTGAQNSNRADQNQAFALNNFCRWRPGGGGFGGGGRGGQTELPQAPAQTDFVAQVASAAASGQHRTVAIGCSDRHSHTGQIRLRSMTPTASNYRKTFSITRRRRRAKVSPQSQIYLTVDDAERCSQRAATKFVQGGSGRGGIPPAHRQPDRRHARALSPKQAQAHVLAPARAPNPI